MAFTRAKRRILTVGVGAMAITALEGIACGNPVAPRCPGSRCKQPVMTQPDAAQPDALAIDAGIDAPEKP